MKKIFVALMIALISSCSVTDLTVIEVGGEDIGEALEMSFSSDDQCFGLDQSGNPVVHFLTAGGKATLQVHSSYPCTYEVSESWVSVAIDNKLSTVTITSERNEDRVPRTAVVMLESESGGKKYRGAVVVLQNGSDTPELTLEYPEYYFPASPEYGAMSKSLDVVTNQDYWTFEYNRNDWLYIVQEGNSLIMSVVPNTGLYRREVNVKVIAGSGSDYAEREIRVVQDAKSFITVSNTFSISYNTVKTHIPITSNYEWSAVSDAQWLSVAKDQNGNLLLSSETNRSSSNPRVATVKITSGPADNNIAEAEILVTQYGYNGRALVLETITSAQGTKITLPLSGEIDCTIDWGDGNVEQVVSPYPQHEYAEPGFHTATITGRVTELNVEGMASFMKYYLTGVVQWGNTGLTSLYRAFYGCENLRFVADDTESSFREVITFEEVFSGCLRLQNIPENLFDSAVKAKSFYGAFQGCVFIPVIPDNLFKNAVAAETFRFVFNGCTSIKSIPAELFASNINAENFYGAFYGCASLENVPQGLFRNNVKANSFGSLFYGCRSLKQIPSGLFDSCPDVVTFSGTFFNCSSLKEVPATIFDNNRKVTIWSDTFAGCSSLTCESPYTIIEGRKVHLYERGDFPESFTTPTTMAGCFRGATGLSDFGSIPSSWR